MTRSTLSWPTLAEPFVVGRILGLAQEGNEHSGDQLHSSAATGRKTLNTEGTESTEAEGEVYILVHWGSTSTSFVYELLYDGRGQDGQPFVIGLVDAHRLQNPSREDLHPQERPA